MIKGLVHQENITVLDVYILNSRASSYMNKKLIKLKGEKSAVIIKGLNNMHSAIDRTTR